MTHFSLWFAVRGRCSGFLFLCFRMGAANRLTKRCSEPRTVLMPSFESMRTSFLAHAIADLVSR